MRTIFTQKQHSGRLRHLVVLFAVFMAITALPLVVPPRVSADAGNSTGSGTVNTLKQKCKDEAAKVNLAKAARKGCDVDDNMKSAINVAGYYCVDFSASKKTSATTGSGTDRSNCTEQKAWEFIKKIVDAKPRDLNGFNLGLATYLTQTGHSLTVPAQGADEGSVDTSYTGGSANCDALDGTCADCNNLDDNGKAPANCVGCVNGTCQDKAADPNTKCGKDTCNLITKYLNPLINLLSISFLLLAVVSIILGGVQYATSEGDPQKTSNAKNRISSTIFAIVAYFFLYALLQFLIPGGLFNT